MTSTFELWKVAVDPEEESYMQLIYLGEHGKFAGEFSQGELEDLKDAIRSWEAQYYEYYG